MGLQNQEIVNTHPTHCGFLGIMPTGFECIGFDGVYVCASIGLSLVVHTGTKVWERARVSHASSLHPTFSNRPMPAPRAPLGEISGNRLKNNELTPVQRGFIEGAIEFGASFSKVAETVSCSKSTIRIENPTIRKRTAQR
jgi:hypothetical protein